jgi:hypothetical protein
VSVFRADIHVSRWWYYYSTVMAVWLLVCADSSFDNKAKSRFDHSSAYRQRNKKVKSVLEPLNTVHFCLLIYFTPLYVPASGGLLARTCVLRQIYNKVPQNVYIPDQEVIPNILVPISRLFAVVLSTRLQEPTRCRSCSSTRRSKISIYRIRRLIRIEWYSYFGHPTKSCKSQKCHLQRLAILPNFIYNSIRFTLLNRMVCILRRLSWCNGL